MKGLAVRSRLSSEDFPEGMKAKFTPWCLGITLTTLCGVGVAVFLCWRWQYIPDEEIGTVGWGTLISALTSPFLVIWVIVGYAQQRLSTQRQARESVEQARRSTQELRAARTLAEIAKVQRIDQELARQPRFRARMDKGALVTISNDTPDREFFDLQLLTPSGEPCRGPGRERADGGDIYIFNIDASTPDAQQVGYRLQYRDSAHAPRELRVYIERDGDNWLNIPPPGATWIIEQWKSAYDAGATSLPPPE